MAGSGDDVKTLKTDGTSIFIDDDENSALRITARRDWGYDRERAVTVSGILSSVVIRTVPVQVRKKFVGSIKSTAKDHQLGSLHLFAQYLVLTCKMFTLHTRKSILGYGSEHNQRFGASDVLDSFSNSLHLFFDYSNVVSGRHIACGSEEQFSILQKRNLF